MHIVVRMGFWVVRALTPAGVQFTATKEHVLPLEGDGKHVLYTPDWEKVERQVAEAETEECPWCLGTGQMPSHPVVDPL